MMDLQDCKTELICRAFPELSRVKIDLKYWQLSDAFFEFTKFSRNSYLVEVDCSLRNSKKEVVLGGMAHEFAHIKREISYGMVRSFIDGLLYDYLNFYQSWDERSTDLLVVERGLGKELLEFLKYADKSREEYTSQDGLTVRELEFLLKSKKLK